jgi:hypothetical protein
MHKFVAGGFWSLSDRSVVRLLRSFADKVREEGFASWATKIVRTSCAYSLVLKFIRPSVSSFCAFGDPLRLSHVLPLVIRPQEAS